MKNYGLREIAREAGVSTATVSRVLNNSDKVSEKTSKHVLEIVKKFNYTPNSFAAALRSGRNNTIGIAVASLSQPWYAKLIRALREAISDRGFRTVIYDLEHDDEVLLKQLKNALELKLSGLVVATGDRLDDPQVVALMKKVSETVPLVVMGQTINQGTWPTVKFNDSYVTKETIEELLKQRTKPMLILGASEKSYLSKVRVEAAMEALSGFPVIAKESEIVNLEYGTHYNAGYEIATKYSKHLNKFGTVFCVNDELALGFSRGAIENGYKIPEDLFVLGFGDIDFLPFVTPSMSSISGDVSEVAFHIVEAILNMINGKTSFQELVLSRTVNHRESTRY